MDYPEEKFENYFHFISSRKNWDLAKAKDTKMSNLGYPQLYVVYLLKNSNTPTDFVITLLKKFFHKSTSEAVKTVLELDKNGRGICQTYTRDAAETKVMQVLEYAQGQQQEIKCIIQKCDIHAIKKS